jgi:hypothetical protein
VPQSFTALFIVIVAVLPGALYTWALEREVGNWGIGFADRVLRFVGVSAVFLAVAAYPVYRFWLAYLHHPTGRAGRFASPLLQGQALPWWVWLLPIGYVAIPIGLGTLAGLSVHRWTTVSRVLVGRDPAPRSWDFLFSPRPAGVVRVEFKDGRFAGGVFAAEWYAAGYPEQPQDVYLERMYRVLDDGTFAEGDDEGGFEEMGSGALIRWDEIKVLEFFHFEDRQEE